MNIYDLRKHITVLNFEKTLQGATIVYKNGEWPSSISLTLDQLFRELIVVGTYEDNYHDRTEFDDSTCISQWDALNIVIRHELAKELAKEIENSDLGKSIENLLNKQL